MCKTGVSRKLRVGHIYIGFVDTLGENNMLPRLAF